MENRFGFFAHHQAPLSEKYAISGKDSVKTLGSRILKECHCICMQDSKKLIYSPMPKQM